MNKITYDERQRLILLLNDPIKRNKVKELALVITKKIAKRTKFAQTLTTQCEEVMRGTRTLADLNTSYEAGKTYCNTKIDPVRADECAMALAGFLLLSSTAERDFDSICYIIGWNQTTRKQHFNQLFEILA